MDYGQANWIAEATKTQLQAFQPQAQITDFEAWLGTLRPLINEALRSYLQTHCEASLLESAHFALDLEEERDNFAKRLRPALTLMAAQSLGAELSQAMPFALACELLHSFTLVHDDIQDGDRTRRGKNSVWVQFGIAEALNLGDYLFALSLRILCSSPVPPAAQGRQLGLIQELSAAMERSGAGQSRDIGSRKRKDLGQDEYLAIVNLKTASLLAAALCGGARLGGADESTISALKMICEHLMPAYQIIDDLLDLSPNKGRAEIGNDIREGKRSFLVLHTATRCSELERDRMYGILDMDRSVTESADVQAVVDLFEKYDAIRSAQSSVEQLQQRALEQVRSLPEPLAHNMIVLIDFMSRRSR